MPAIPTLDFVVFYVADLDESLAYFTEKLGFESLPDQSSPIFRSLKGSEEKIGFGLNVATNETPPAGTVELYFKTDDLEGLHRTLTAKGAGTTPILHLPFGSVFNVQSPDKHAVVMLGDPA
jgi:catechol 2,3-dioxygenase-like lactoylglutathione lyase family enzyme